MAAKGDGEPSENDIEVVVDSIAQMREGLEKIRGGLGVAAEGATSVFQGSLNGLGKQALIEAERVIGRQALDERLKAAMEAVEDSMGISEDGVPPVIGGPPFNLRTAVWLAGAAFDSYNDPSGGLKKRYDDGTSVSYSSSNAIASLHSGVLMIKLGGAGLVAGAGMLGTESARCDPFARIKVSGVTIRSQTLKQTMNPVWDETYVVYTDRADMEGSEVCIEVFDADLPFGKDDMDAVTPDPLIGSTTVKVSSLVEAGQKGFQQWSLNLESPAKPTTLQDIENANNPYWMPLPRGAVVQSWASIVKGGATGGLVDVSVQFFPLELPPLGGSETPPPPPPPSAIEEGTEAISEGDWNLLANWPVDGAEGDAAHAIEREGLERLCFIENEETDTQVSVWRDYNGKRMVLAFRGTEQVKWKDLLTDALLVQHPFEPGAPEAAQTRLPPLLESATQSLGIQVADGEGGRGLLDAGILGSVIGGLASKEGIEALFGQVSKEGQNIGKVLEKYKFGDITKGLLAGLSPPASSTSSSSSSDSSPAAKEGKGYQFGDITKGLLQNLKIGPMLDKSDEEERVMVHLGFLRGYLSVRERLTKLVERLTPEGDEWSLYITGHSLGGALATLCATDMAEIFPGRKVVMYNYGSPRVGNAAFVNRFNSDVCEAFRVVNDADVVARVPRSRGFAYHHVGRTALVSKAEGGSGRGSLWVEGESDGSDPLRDRWSNLSDLLEAEVALLQGLIKGESLGDHMEDAYYAALKQALSASSKPNA